MTQIVPENQLQQLSAYILKNTGLFFPPSKWHTLQKAVKTAAAENGSDITIFIERLLDSSSPKQFLDSLVDYLTIGETYFLRDKNLFQTLKDTVIQGIIDQAQHNEKRICFLCAGCATGEEPYSIAILIDHFFPVLKNWRIKIIGIDINESFLQKAQNAAYSSWSLRETPEQIVKKYFIPTTLNRFELLPRIKQMVRFVRLNLMEADYENSIKIHDEIHVLLCRNVLMYFDEPTRNQVVKKLAKLIKNNGWFITGPAETGFIKADELFPIKISSIIIHQKKGLPAEENRNHTPLPEEGVPKKQKAFSIEPPKISKPTSFASKERSNLFKLGKTDIEIYEEALKNYEDGNYKVSAIKLSSIMARRKVDKHGILIESQIMTLLAKSHANMGELDDAIYWCRKAIDSEKLNPEIYFFQSSLFQNAGKPKEAIHSLRQALYLDPDFIMAHFLIGLLLLQENNVRESHKSMSNALSLLKTKDPDEIISFSEGMTVSRLIDTITGILSKNIQR